MTNLRVMTWNTNHKGIDVVREALRRVDVDIAVLPESRQPPPDLYGASSSWWFGDDPDRGVLVLGYGCEVRPVEASHVDNGASIISRLSDCSPSERWAERATVRLASGLEVRLLAVWADNTNADRPALTAIREHRGWLSGGSSIVAGDFNHHRKWDHKRWNLKDHARTVEELAALGLLSAFHTSRGQFESGRSEVTDRPTFWAAKRSHHIDYVYAPVAWIKDDPASVTVADRGDFPGDHAPVIASLTVDRARLGSA